MTPACAGSVHRPHWTDLPSGPASLVLDERAAQDPAGDVDPLVGGCRERDGGVLADGDGDGDRTAVRGRRHRLVGRNRVDLYVGRAGGGLVVVQPQRVDAAHRHRHRVHHGRGVLRGLPARGAAELSARRVPQEDRRGRVVAAGQCGDAAHEDPVACLGGEGHCPVLARGRRLHDRRASVGRGVRGHVLGQPCVEVHAEQAVGDAGVRREDQGVGARCGGRGEIHDCERGPRARPVAQLLAAG